MADGFLRMKEEEFDMYSSGLKKNSDGFASTNDNFRKKFQSFVDTGLSGGSVGKIGNQMASITNSINNVNNIIRKHSNQMFGFDKEVSNKANDIDIPQDFVANDSASVNYYTETLVGKIDGKSVNEGHQTQKVNEVGDSEVNKENLIDIRGASSKLENYDGNSSILGQSIMSDISGNVTQEQNYNDSSNVQKAVLGNISGNNASESTYDDTTIIGRSTLGDISGGFAKAPEYQDNTGMITKAALENVRQAEETKETVFNDLQSVFSSSMAKEIAEEGKNEHDGSSNVR